MTHSEIQNKIKQYREHISELALQAGRDPHDVKLLAISKTHPVDYISASIEAGQLCFGESRVQEALPKIESLAENAEVEWHLIGHLQKNKVRFCPGKFHWCHSIDSLELAKRLEARCVSTNNSMQVLIQANLSREENKHGFMEPDEVLRTAEYLLSCKGLYLRGLMTMAAYQSTESQARHIFSTLFEWREKLWVRLGKNRITELSMGMSSDYQWAIPEGSTIIRLGGAIFGERYRTTD